MPTEVEVAGEGIFEFPDGMGDDEIQSILRKQFPISNEPFVPAAPRQPIPPERLTTYGGPPKQLASAAEALVEPVEEMMNPRVTLPRIPIKETDPLYLTAGKEAVNVLAGLPEFMSSNVGLLGMVGGAAAPVATAGAFTADMLHSLGKQVVSAVKDWDMLTPTQKTTAVVDMAGTGAFAGLLGTHAGRGIADRVVPARALAKQIREAPLTPLPAQRVGLVQEGARIEPPAGMVTPETLVREQPQVPRFEEKLPTEPTILAPEKTDVVPQKSMAQLRAEEVEAARIASDEAFKRKQAGIVAKPTTTLPKLVETLGRDEVAALVDQWEQGAELHPDGKSITVYADPRNQTGKMRGKTKDFLSWYEEQKTKPDVTPTVTETAKPEVAPTIEAKAEAEVGKLEAPKGEPVNLFESGKQYLLDNGERVVWLGRASPGKFDQYDIWRIRKIVDGKAQPEETVYGRNFHETKQTPFLSGKSQGELGYEYEQLKWQLAEQKQQTGNAGKVNRANTRARMKAIEEEQKLLEAERKQPTPKPAETPVEVVGNRLAELTAKVESGQKITASEKKQYLKLRDEATKKEPEAARAQISVGPGAAAPLDIAAESAAQSAGIRTAEYINRGLETKDIATKPDITVPEADLKSADPQVEARWRAARLSKASPLEKAKQAIAASKYAMTRHFRFLDPKTDGVVTDILRVHENDPLHAKFMASQVMRGITEGLKPKKYDVFSRIVILRDLVKYGEQFGQDLADLPFGYKSWDAVKNDLARFNALAEKYPDIKESLRRRDEFMDALRYDLVARGLLNEKVKDFGEYFHHQVLQYMAMKEPFASIGSTDVRTHGKGWQKGRTGSAKDYNTSYLESEFEVISQSFAQMATQDTLKQLKAASDISDQLKIAAKDARESGSDVTWEQLIPDDHTIWQPQQGNHFYWANSITEKALDAYLKGQKQLTEADIKEVLAMGGPREQWVIPKRLAKTLDEFTPKPDKQVEKVIGAGISHWKRWTLFNPMRNVIYELNNLSGDADIAFAVDPKIFKYTPQSAKEVADFVRSKKGATKEMSDLVRLGVIDSGFSVQELPDLKGNQFFRALEGKDPSLIQHYWENVLDFNRWREGVLRLSSYKRAMELLQSGKKPYWTSKQSEMDALYKDPNVTREQIAAKLAREAIGDYGNISYAGQWIRSKLIPFYSWMEINAPRYVRLMQNASKEEGGSVAGRVAGVAGKKVITQSAKLAARMSAFYFLANLWNRSMFPEEDRELNSTRDQFHVILRRNADGSITSLRLQGAFSDALSWFGAQDLIKDVKDVQGGLATPQEKAAEMAKAPVNKVAQGAWPIYKTLFEALVKKGTYPDVFNPRPIRDSKAHIARMVSLGSIYDYLAKHPQRPGTWTLKALATYTTDPGEAAYLTAKSIVADKLKEMNVERPGAEPTEKSNALYYWKQSIRYKNPKLEEYWRNRYFELGGKAQYLDTGLRNTSPYNGVSKANRGKFESLLSPAEKEIMQRADDWYRKVYIER